MTALKSAAIVTKLAFELIERGSWCGATHIQKATYFLQELAGVPLEYEFVLYWHGPYSFDLSDHITAMTADDLLEVKPQPAPYGPKFIPSQTAHHLWAKYPKTLGKVDVAITFVANRLGDQGATRLEQLSTALLVLKEDYALDPDSMAKEVRKLKPHVTESGAIWAVEEVLKMKEEWHSTN